MTHAGLENADVQPLQSGWHLIVTKKDGSVVREYHHGHSWNGMWEEAKKHLNAKSPDWARDRIVSIEILSVFT